MAKSTYVDGFVLMIPEKNAAAYKKMAQDGKKAWMKFGALDYKECVIDDAAPGGVATFAKMVKPKPGEQIWFSYITFKSRAHRDAVNKKVMAYFEKKYSEKDMKDMPFDMKRMATAGFKVVVGS